MRRVRKGSTAYQQAAVATPPLTMPVDDDTVTLAMIQALIPLRLRAVEAALQQEVTALAGARYAHHDDAPGVVRWGQQAGSIYLADQKLPNTAPRVRDQQAGCEVPLATYATLQTPRACDTGLFRRIRGGISCREYEAAAEAVREAFGSAKSTVSRRFVRASARALRQLHERRHDDATWLVLLLDGKAFAAEQLVIALGVTTAVDNRILGMAHTATENTRACAAFLRELEERGFHTTPELLVVLDGAKGLRAAVREAYGDVPVQRCHWHKRESVVSYLTKPQQTVWRRKLQAAYAHASYADAHRALQRLVRQLTPMNASAARSLEEGLDETLTLPRLGVAEALGTSFKTTNLIASVMAHVDAKTRRVDRWRTSDLKLRWCAACVAD